VNAELARFVTGHDVSRAEKRRKMDPAVAAAGHVSELTAHLADSSNTTERPRLGNELD
jgi:hypothetical protein